MRKVDLQEVIRDIKQREDSVVKYHCAYKDKVIDFDSNLGIENLIKMVCDNDCDFFIRDEENDSEIIIENKPVKKNDGIEDIENKVLSLYLNDLHSIMTISKKLNISAYQVRKILTSNKVDMSNRPNRGGRKKQTEETGNKDPEPEPEKEEDVEKEILNEIDELTDEMALKEIDLKDKPYTVLDWPYVIMDDGRTAKVLSKSEFKSMLRKDLNIGNKKKRKRKTSSKKKRYYDDIYSDEVDDYE